MSNKIAAVDADAMNRLFAQELTAGGVKTAAGEQIEAFADHASYVATLEAVLSSDKGDDKSFFTPELD